MTHSHWLESTRGYIALGMLDEAWKTLDSVPDESRDHPDFRKQRIVILLNRKDYEGAFEHSKKLIAGHPNDHEGYIQAAYSLHELGRSDEARECLQTGPDSMREEPLYFYNLGCYDLSVGNTDAAVAWLKRSFEMNPRLLPQALEDPDLSAIHEVLKEEKA